MHHPFTAPKAEDVDKLFSDPEHVSSRAYDLVLNGYELLSGSIRIHDQDLQEKVFEAIGLTMEQAKEKLRDLQYSYQRSAVSLPTFDYSSQYRAINNAEKAKSRAAEKLEEARKACEIALGSTGSIENIKAQAQEVEALKSALDAADNELIIAKANLDSLKADEDKAKAEVDNLKQQEAMLQAQIAVLENDQGQGGQSGDPGQSGEQGGQDNNQSNSQEQSSNALMSSDFSAPPVVEELEPPAELDGAEDTGIETLANTKTMGHITFLKAVQPLNQAPTGNYVLLADSSELTDLKMQLAVVQTQLADAEAKLAAIQNGQSTESSYSEAVKKAEENLARCQEAYYQAIAKYKSTVPATLLPYIEAYENAEEDYRDARDDLDYAQQALVYAQEANSRTAAASSVDLQQLAEQIALQQEKIKSLAGDEENVITANVSGTVNTVDCTAGDTVLKDALLCTIEVPDMGHTLTFSVTNDQAQRLRIGDTATVSNYYWGNSITATLTSIRTDPKNPQTSKLLTFDLTGDVTTGAELTISVGQKSANYDLIVPNSAIKSDTNGSYVLAVSVKSSPLGNRYTARRVSVEVLANDDNNSAVVADLANGDYVITTSSAPLSSGDMVRMADS